MTTAAKGSNGPPVYRRALRPVLRQATLILPRTGERVKRSVTIRDPAFYDGSNNDANVDELSTRDSRHSVKVGEHTSWQRLLNNWEALWRPAWTFATSKTGQGIFKCSIAYLIGSLATFVPPIAAWLGQQDGKHMVATITVYFHPARSQGSMFEAILLAVVAFLYAVFICFTSMAVSIFFGRTLDLIVVGHVIVLIVFCGGGLGFVAFVKLRLGNPLVNISCSLTSLAIITVLTKEGAVQAASFSDDKVIQVMKMIAMGVCATTAVSFLVRPVSARKEWRENMIQVTDAFSYILSTITHSFLTGSEQELQEDSFLETSNRYKSLFTSLDKNLNEAKFEHYFWGTEREHQLEVRLTKCMQRLSQNIGGLRSAAATQFDLLSQPPAGGGTPTKSSHSSITNSNAISLMVPDLPSPRDQYGVLTAIDESPEDNVNSEEISNRLQNGATDQPYEDNLPTVHSPSEIFTRFILHLGPSMKSLTYTLKQILEELPYGPGPEFNIAINPNFRSSLSEAVDLYGKAREEALSLLYQNKELRMTRSTELEADFEEVAASCGHFSFSLQDVAHEMGQYLDILDDLKLETDERPRGRTWTWLKFWRKRRIQLSDLGTSNDPERDVLDNPDQYMKALRTVPKPARRKDISEPDQENPHSKQTLGFRLWKALHIFRRDDTKFAVKVGVGAALYALPSFLKTIRPIYQHWRGEWGLLSYMLVCSMTIGASNTTGFERFFGTCLGAVCAIAAWIVSQGNVFALAALGWIMALWTAYIIVAQGKGPMGRFIMLTYNLSALYAYSLSVRDYDNDDDEGGGNPVITDIALHRVVAVLSGCLWGLIITRLIWPISARRKFKDGLSMLWLRMALIWKRDPLTKMLQGDTPDSYMDLREEFALQQFLFRLENLRTSACSEYQLQGPFPGKAYGRVLKSTGRMLDAFHAMNIVISKDPKASKGEAALLRYTADERHHLCTRISHLFQVLASSMKLEFPMNDALPNTDHARDRLLAKIFRFRKSDKVARGTTDEDFALLYAYALVTGQLSKEIQEVGQEIGTLFGVLDEDVLKLQ